MKPAGDIERYKRACGLLIDALEQYADPEFYHAIAILADRPAGGFSDDFGPKRDPNYQRQMPGKLARKTLSQVGRRYGDLAFYSKRGS